MDKRKFLILLFTALWAVSFSQNGIVKGKLTEEQNDEQIPLPFANVFLEGTTYGSISDFDGNYQFVAPMGNYNLVCSFMGYETFKKAIVITDGGEITANIGMKPEGIAIEGVEVTAKMNRESEMALMMEQKRATVIKESIGSKRLSKLGVSDAAAATTKISGVTKNESSGDVYVRGLGDRYLITTMNGLPIPSDDVGKKNIDLNLFSTDIIKNVSINKTYSVENYGDQSSGNVDITSKNLSEKISIGISSGINTNVLKSGIFDDFKATQNYSDVTLGIYDRPYGTLNAITDQSWNTKKRNLPIGFGLSVLVGKKINLFGNDLSVFATVSHSGSSEYQEGIYKKYRSNVLDNSFTDAKALRTRYNTTGLLNLIYDFDNKNSINFNSLLVYKTIDELYEQGRNGEGFVFDQDPQEDGAFVRDQNLKETQMSVNQILGSHDIGTRNSLQWAAAYNFVNSEEPNRIRNEVNILDENIVQFAHVGDYQQRKSLQNIEDSEVNGYLKNGFRFIDEDNKKLNFNFGGNFRSKQRDFNSLFIGVKAKGVQVSSIDDLDEALLDKSLYNSGDLNIREGKPDLYTAQLDVYAGYLNTGFELNKLSGSMGVRYEIDELTVDWNVANYIDKETGMPRIGNITNSYNNIFPALNLKYQVTEKSALRLATSKTITLPEFKELSPFEYVSPTGRVTKGNPNLKNSENYNFDLKWEMFPTTKELISVSGFYKMINDPINLAQTRGSSGNFFYANTGDKANVYGIELETRFNIIKSDRANTPGLNMVVNVTKMWFKQDLLEEFQYNNRTETDLQGASGFIVNGTLSYSNNKENEFIATITGNYSSDKILALGAPEDFENSATLFNNEIIEKGFITVDLIISKKISDKISVKLSGKNLLNPKIEQTQGIKPLSGEASTEVVSSYKKGISLSFGININLN